MLKKNKKIIKNFPTNLFLNFSLDSYAEEEIGNKRHKPLNLLNED